MADAYTYGNIKTTTRTGMIPCTCAMAVAATRTYFLRIDTGAVYQVGVGQTYIVGKIGGPAANTGLITVGYDNDGAGTGDTILFTFPWNGVLPTEMNFIYTIPATRYPYLAGGNATVAPVTALIYGVTR